MSRLTLVHYLPLATTLISFVFSAVVYRRYKARGSGNHLAWWSFGILVYGLGTMAESWITLFGWGPVVFKAWYIVGALMGGAPLAQGTVWLLLRPKSARRLTIALVAVIVVASACVVSSPIDHTRVDPHLPSGSAFQWQWVRAFSPFINTYAVIFLIGGAIWSAVRFRRAAYGSGTGAPLARDRFLGNVLIALGAILPGLGGASSRAGYTEVLYIMELAGILLIWPGYWLNVRNRPIHVTRTLAVSVPLLLLTLALPRPGNALPILPPGGPPAHQAEAELIVRVTGPQGELLTETTVELNRLGIERNIQETTDELGVARFRGLRAGEYTIGLPDSGYVALARQVSLSSGVSVTVELRLRNLRIAEEVTVAATKSRRDPFTVAGEVNSVQRGTIDLVQGRSLDDVLRYEPGVDMSESPRRLGQTPNIRGFDDLRVLTLRDGMRAAQFNSGHRGTQFIDLEDVERIEVIRGPASALYGSGALGGVLSIKTRDPVDLVRPGETWGGQVRAAYSSAYGEWMISPRLFGRSGTGTGWMLSYTGRRNDGEVDLAGAPATLRQAEEDIDALAARLTAPVSSDGLLRLSFDLYRQRGSSSANLASIDVGPSEIVDRETAQAGAQARYSHTGGAWWNRDLSISAYVNDLEIEETRLFDGRLDDIEYRTLGGEIRSFTPIGNTHRVTYGVELVHDRQLASRNNELHAFFPGGRQTLTGVYAQDEIYLADGRLHIVPGVRWDRWDSRPEDIRLAASSVNRLTPKLGVTWEFAPHWALSTSYGEGFRPPLFQELFLSDVHFAYPLPGHRFFLALFLPSPQLRPERSRNNEIGLRFRKASFSGRISFWRAEVDDFIELLPISTTPFPPPGGLQMQLWKATNRTDAKLAGIEVSTLWAPHVDWTVQSSFASTTGEDRATGQPLLQITPAKLVLGAQWRRPDLGTTVSWNTSVYGDRVRVPTDVPGLLPTKGYSLHDFHLSWSPGTLRRVKIYLGVNNLLDTEYDNARFGTPGIGRDYRLGLGYQF